MIAKVLVRTSEGLHFDCMPTVKGYACGACKRTLLSLSPSPGDRCPNCGAVAVVFRIPDTIEPRRRQKQLSLF